MPRNADRNEQTTPLPEKEMIQVIALAKQDKEKQLLEGQTTLVETPTKEGSSSSSFVTHRNWQFVVNSSIRRGRVF